VREVLEALLDLQRIDVELAGLEAAKARLPRRLSELALQKERLRAAVADVEEKLAAARSDLVRRQRDLDGLAAKRNDLIGRQLIIKTNAEYAALTHEIEFVKRDIAEGEDAVLRLMEDAERLAADVEAVRANAERETQAIDGRIEELTKQLEAAGDDVAVKRDERLRTSKRVDPTTLARYERILASKGDTAVAAIENGTCSGCHMRLPQQTIIEVRRGQQFRLCEGCGRILSWRGEGGGG